MDAPALGSLAKSTSQATARLLIFVLALQATSLQAFAPDRDGKRGQPDESAQHRSPITRELPVSEKAGPSALVGTMAVQPFALFVVGSTSLTTSDAAVKSRLEGLGYSVTVKSANSSATTAPTARTSSSSRRR